MDVRLEDGTIVKNVPDGMTQSELLARLGRTPASPEPLAVASAPPPSTWKDQLGGMARSAGSELVGSLSAIQQAFVPSDLGGSVATTLTGAKIPTGREMNIASVNKIASATAGRKVNPLINDVSELPPDQRALGTMAGFIGGSLPFMGAPGSVIPTLTGAVGGGLAEKYAPGNKWARIAAQIVGSMSGAGLQQALKRAPNPPTTQYLKEMAGMKFKAVEDSTVLKPEKFHEMADDVLQFLQNERIDPTLHPKASAAMATLVKDAEAGIQPTLKDVHKIQRLFGIAVKSLDAEDSRLGVVARDIIDDSLDTLTPDDVLTPGNPQAAVKTFNEARNLWSKFRKSETLEDMIDMAKLDSVSEGVGREAKLRGQFKALVKKREFSRFSADEQTAIRRVAEGGFSANAARAIGQLAPTDLKHALISGGVGFLTGGPVGVGTAFALGGAGRAASGALTGRNARIAAELARRGSKLPPTPIMGPVTRAGSQAAIVSAIQERKRKDKR